MALGSASTSQTLAVAPTVFVSYSHDTPDHKAWVLRLATDLRDNGVDARLDRWHLRPGEETGRFMEREVRESQKVLVVCTDSYVAKAAARIGGAGYESALVTAELVANQGTAKFIPILRNNAAGATPSYLKGRVYVDFRSDDDYEASLTTLLRAARDLPAMDPPPIGEPPLNSTLSAPRSAPVFQNPVEAIEELLQNRDRRIQLSKSLWGYAEKARAELANGDLYAYAAQPATESIGSRVTQADAVMAQLLPLLATMGKWATREQIPIAAQIVAHFLDVPAPKGTFYQANEHIVRYPALVAAYAVGAGALSEDRFDNFRAVLFASVASRRNREEDQPFVVALHGGAPFAQDFWMLLPGMERRYTPVSDHVFEYLTNTIPDVFGRTTRPERLFDRIEATVSFSYLDGRSDDRGWAPLGSYLWRDAGLVERLQAELASQGAEWPPLKAGFFGGAVDRATQVLSALADHLIRVRQQRGVH